MKFCAVRALDRVCTHALYLAFVAGILWICSILLSLIFLHPSVLGTNSSMGHLCPLALYSANLSSSSKEWPREMVKAINKNAGNIRLILCKSCWSSTYAFSFYKGILNDKTVRGIKQLTSSELNVQKMQ